MPDNISLISVEPVVESLNFQMDSFQKYGLTFYPYKNRGSCFVKYFCATYHNLDIRILFNCRLQITGSLPKFYNDYVYSIPTNHLDFKFNYLMETIVLLESKFEIDSKKLKISTIENGVNLIMNQNPNDYIKLISLYKYKYSFENMKKRGLNYGVKTFLSNKELKFYNKKIQVKATLGIDIHGNILRFEIKSQKNDPIFKKVRYLSDFKSIENYIIFKEHLAHEFNRLSFIEKNLDASFLPKSEMILYHASRSKSFLQELAISGMKNIHNTRNKIKKLEKVVIEHCYSNATLTNELRTKLVSKIKLLTTCNIQ